MIGRMSRARSRCRLWQPASISANPNRKGAEANPSWIVRRRIEMTRIVVKCRTPLGDRALVASDHDAHIEPSLHLRLRLRESRIPIEHTGVVAHHEAGGSEIGGHLLTRPGADLRLADQPKQQPREEST